MKDWGDVLCKGRCDGGDVQSCVSIDSMRLNEYNNQWRRLHQHITCKSLAVRAHVR